MGHAIRAVVAGPAAIATLCTRAGISTQAVELPQGFHLLFAGGRLLDAVAQVLTVRAEAIGPFFHLDTALAACLEAVAEPLVYLETDYFGGEGTQCAAFFTGGRLDAVYPPGEPDAERPYPECLLNQPINTALRRLGVRRAADVDEFDALGLAAHRRMPDEE